MLFMFSLTVRVLTRLLVFSEANDGTKDVEILVLRQQLRVLRRKTGRPRFTARDRVLLAAASRALPRQRWASSFLVTPQTLLRWHRTLVRRKWTYGKGKERTPGRPPIDPQTIELILLRICGELRKLGIQVGATTIRALLRRHGLGPAPRRCGPTWAQFLRAQAEGVVACDLLHGGDDPTPDPLCVVLHPAQHQAGRSRRDHGAPRHGMGHPAGQECAMEFNDRGVSIRFLLRDRDAKFTRSFDDVFGSEGGQVLCTPIRAPKANAYAERWVQTVRAECLNWTLVCGRRHLLRLLRGYVRHYNQQRPHRSLALAVPEPEAGERESSQVIPPEVERRDVLGGLIHEYHEVAA